MKTYTRILIALTAFAFGPALAAGLDDLKRADNALEQGKPQQALELADQALASGELNIAWKAVAHLKRAEAFMALNKPQQALASYSRVVEIDPRNPLGFSFRGQLYMQLQKYDEAIRDFTRVIALDPGKATGWINRAMASMAKGSLGDPLQDLRRAIEVEPDNPVAYYFRANLYFYQGNYAAAASDYRRHTELAPGDAYSIIKLYQTAARVQDDAKQELARLAGTIEARKWPYPVVELYLGKLAPQDLLDKVSSAQTRGERERALEIYFYVGYYYLLAGDKARAIELFERAVATGITDFNEHKTAKAEIWRLKSGG